MALPWFRLDSHIGSHDKILALLSDPSAKRWQAAFSYVSAIGWSVDHGTNGRIPQSALPFIHATPTTARLLVQYDLWIERTAAWEVKNFLRYQQAAEVDAEKVASQSFGGKKARCRANHGPECGCNYMSAPPTPIRKVK